MKFLIDLILDVDLVALFGVDFGGFACICFLLTNLTFTETKIRNLNLLACLFAPTQLVFNLVNELARCVAVDGALFGDHFAKRMLFARPFPRSK